MVLICHSIAIGTAFPAIDITALTHRAAFIGGLVIIMIAVIAIVFNAMTND